MAKLNIELIADATKGIEELNKFTGSTAKARDQLIKAKEGTDEYNESVENLSLGLSRDLYDAAHKATSQLKSYEAQLKVLLKHDERIRQGLGDTSDEYKTFTNLIETARGEIDRLTKEEDKAVVVNDKFKASIKNTAPAVDKFALTVKESSEETKNYGAKLVSIAANILKFQLLMGPITGLVRGFKNTLSDSVKVAGEAEQTFSKLSTVFDGFEDSARRAASGLAFLLGVSKSTAAGALSTVGDLLQAQGMGTAESLSTSSTWVKQFQDIIAFKDINMSLEEFAQSFMSGAAGNLRNFRTFGSIVKESAVNARLASEGLDKLTGSQLELAKMTTRANMALEQQANAMGATEREWDTMLSVNRRLSEAWKEYKENLGDTLNSFVKPFKRDITEILDKINKSNRAAKELANGSLTSNVYNIKTNEKDRAAFKKDLLTEFNTYEGDYNRFANGTITAEDTLGFEALDYVMRMYAASLEDVSNILGNKLPDAARLYLKTLEDARNAQMELNKAIEGRKTKISSASDRYGTFAESVLGITGVSFNASSFADAQGRYSATEEGTNFLLGQIASTIMNDVDSALKSIKTSDLAETWGSVIGGALDELNHGELLQGRIDSVRQLFENTWNEFVPEGFTEEEKTKLEEIKATYKGYIDELNAYNEELKRVQSFASALSGMRGVASDYDVQLAQLGMTDEQRATDNLRRQYATAYALAKTAEEQKQIDDAYAESEQTMLAFFNAQKKYNAELKAEADEKARLAKYEDAIKSINESTADYMTQIAQIGMTDEQKALDDLRIAFEKQMASLTLTEEEGEKLTKAYNSQVEALALLQKKQREYNLQLEREAMMKNAVAQRNGTAVPTTWQDQLANFGLSSTAIVRNELVAQRDALIGKHDSLWVAFQKEIDALDKVVKVISWQNLGNRALNSTGTLGGVINSFKGDGDIWTKILNAVLTILENTEGWERVAALLDQVFAAFEPVVDALVDLLVSLPWNIIIFCVKVIASVIVVIAKFFEQLFNVFDWLWTNIKAAFHNLGEIIRHPVNKGARDTWSGMSWGELQTKMEATAEKEVEILTKIWGTAWSIDKKMENKDLAVLEDLWKRGILSTQQYYREAGSLQGYYNASPATIDPSHYAGSQVSISRGNVILNIYTNNPQEIRKELERWATEEGYSTSGTSLVGGY